MSKFTIQRGKHINVGSINAIITVVGENATECSEGMSLLSHTIILIARDNDVSREDFLHGLDLLWQKTEGEGKIN